jgi:hypothetical protein
VDAAGRVTALTDGEALIAVSAPRIRRGVRLVVSVSDRQFLSFVNGSLAAHCSEAVDSRIAGRDPATAKAIFATQDHVASVYVRNPACWCADVDLTCLSPWNSDGGNNKAGTLISPRHILFAKHYRIATGATVRFVTADDQLIERTMTARHDVADADLCVGLLDGDVPASIGFARVLPADALDYLPGAGYRVPGLLLDQEEKALVGDLTAQSFNSFSAPTDPQRLAFHEETIGGDSGNPAFLLIDTGNGVEPVLATTWTGGGGGSGPNISALHDEINAAMTTLGGGYQLTPANLDEFPSYE